MQPKDRIIVALDVDTPEAAIKLVSELKPHVGMFKIGMQLIYSMFAGMVTGTDGAALEIFARSRELFGLVKGQLFTDLKFHDIFNTVAGAAKAISPINSAMFNLHASADVDAMMGAVANKSNSRVLAVTVLTSLGEEVVHLIYGDPAKGKVLEFARNAKLAGVDGLVCSPQEVTMLRSRRELKGMILVTPGIRPVWASKDDQTRVGTPAGAIEVGADYLVIGRPITNPPAEIGFPVDAVHKIVEEIVAIRTDKCAVQ